MLLLLLVGGAGIGLAVAASRLSNGSRASFTYDAASNITRLANLKNDLTTLSSFDYRYDKVNNRKAMIEGDGARTTYSYDNAYQLLSEFRTGSSAYRNTYTYDNAANRTLKNESGARTTTTYDAANQINYALAAAGRTTYTYDADGNQQRVLEPSGARTTTLWDYENKTKLVQLPSGVRNTMAYEPDGLRVQVQNSLGTSRFIYDGQAFLLETDGSNVTVAVFTNEPSAYTNAISQRRGSTTSWFQFDALGSTRQLSDASQNITDSYLSNAWGVPLAATGSTVNWLRYVGQYGYWFEVDTGNYNIGQRVYRPVIARWTSVDPLNAIISLAFFSYANNDPAQSIDPQGLAPQGSKTFTTDIVAKSFINGIPVIGALPLWRTSTTTWPLTYLFGPVSFAARLKGVPPATLGTATGRLNLLSALVSGLDAFNQLPLTDAKDQTYRLYTRVQVRFCCEGNALTAFKVVSTDHEGGKEIGPISGTMNISNVTQTNFPPSSTRISWQGWGKPNPLVEPGMQWVANRTSLNIWHASEIDLSCTDGIGYHRVAKFEGSTFPSRRLWINSGLEAFQVQGAYADLWWPKPQAPTFVE